MFVVWRSPTDTMPSPSIRKCRPSSRPLVLECLTLLLFCFPFIEAQLLGVGVSASVGQGIGAGVSLGLNLPSLQSEYCSIDAMNID